MDSAAEKLKYLPKIQEWLERGDQPRSEWIKIKPFRMYVRNWPYFTIANISCAEKQMGKGHLTAMLDEIEPVMTVKFETVVNARLRDYLNRRGYVQGMEIDWVKLLTFNP